MQRHHTPRPLTEIVSLRRSTLKPDQFPTDALYVGLEHIESCTGRLTAVSAEGADLRSAKNRFEQGDVLFGKLRPKLRKSAVAPFPGVCSTDILVLKPIAELPAALIALQLRSESMLPTFERLVAGANLPRLAARDLAAIELWVPDTQSIAALNSKALTVTELRDAVVQLNVDVAELESALAASLSTGSA